MAGITRTLTFAEGVSTTGPTTTFLQTTQFATYADEATFVSNKGSAAADGDAFYDTTLDVVKIYADGAWQIFFDDSDTNVALLTGTQTFSGSKTFSSAVTISDSTSSTTKDTGSLVVEGGIGIEENLNVGGNVVITGNLTVNGTTTTVNTTDLDVTDANITVNKGGNQATADSNDAGITVEMSDATDALMHYDSTATSKWKCGESGSTKEVATISDAQQLTNKDIDGGTASNSSRMTLPKASTSTLDGLTRKEGTLVFDTDINKVKYDDGTNLNELGGGSGGINYIENGDAEGGITGWATYADAAGTTPVDGTGGSPTVTWTSSASAPLRDVQSFVLTKDAADRQGEGVSYDFTIDSADIHNVMSISFDYDTSANYVDDDVIVYIYNVDSGRLIEPVPTPIKAGEYGKFTAQFQTDDTDTNYRLIFHVSSTNANAYTVKIDNIKLGPYQKVYSTPITDWEDSDAYIGAATSFSLGSGEASAKQRRVGDCMEFMLYLRKAADTTITGNVRGVLPSGMLIDISKVPDNFQGLMSEVAYYDSSAATSYQGFCFINNNSTTHVECSVGDTGNRLVSGTPVAFGTNDEFWLTFSVPIQGFSNSVQLSDNLGTRDVFASGAGNGGTVITASTTNIDFTEVDDNSGSFDGTTFTLPVSGTYHLEGAINFTTALERTPALYVNGTLNKIIGARTGAVDTVGFSTLYKGSKGDAITIRVETNGGTLSNSTTYHNIGIKKVSSPEVIFGGELVACRYSTNSGQSISNATWTDIVFDDLDTYDTHGIMNISNGRMTAQVSGKFSISTKVSYASASWAAGEGARIALYKNGAVYSQLDRDIKDAAVTDVIDLNGHDEIDLIAGDYVTIATYQNQGAAVSLGNADTYELPYVSFKRIGF